MGRITTLQNQVKHLQEKLAEKNRAIAAQNRGESELLKQSRDENARLQEQLKGLRNGS